MAVDLSRIPAELSALHARIDSLPVLRWAVVTSLDPLLVQLDGDPAPLLGAPSALVASDGLAVGDRVQVSIQNRRVTIQGRGGGVPVSAPGQGEIPTAITTTGAGSSASISPDGTITATNCATINLDGVFDGGDNAVYKIYATFAQSVVGTLYTRMRYGGNTFSPSVYNYVAHYTRNAAGPTRYSVFGASQFGFWWANIQAIAAITTGEMTVYYPNRNGQTTIDLRSTVMASDRYLISEYGESGSGSIPFDGFSIILGAGSGSFSGTLKVVRVA